MLGLRLPDGALRWVSVDTQPLLGRDGAVEGVIACLVDLTEKRAQEARLGLMVDGAALGTWEFELRDGKAASTSAGPHARLRAGGAACRHRHLAPARPPGRPAGVEAAAGGASEDPSVPYQAELRMRHRQGHWAWVFTAGAVIERDGDGRPRLMAGVHLDIDRAKRAEAAIDEARTRAERALSELRAYQAALDQHAIVAVTDPRAPSSRPTTASARSASTAATSWWARRTASSTRASTRSSSGPTCGATSPRPQLARRGLQPGPRRFAVLGRRDHRAGARRATARCSSTWPSAPRSRSASSSRSSFAAPR